MYFRSPSVQENLGNVPRFTLGGGRLTASPLGSYRRIDGELEPSRNLEPCALTLRADNVAAKSVGNGCVVGDRIQAKWQDDGRNYGVGRTDKAGRFVPA
jgi:hypothetical protein